MFKNVIIKVSGEALQGEKAMSGSSDCLYPAYDDATVDTLVSQIISLKNKGVKVSLVIGGGNFWRGRDAKAGMNRAKADQIGMLATVMNAIYLSEAFKTKGADAVVMTPFVVGTFTEQFEISKAINYIDKGVILIFAGGSGLPFFSTDTITTIRGAELGVDAVLFAKNVNGVYDSDPKKNPDAIKYDTLTYSEIISKNLRVIDISAMDICKDRQMTSVVFGLNTPGSIISAVFGQDADLFKVGTKITC